MVDETNWKILQALQEDARLTYAEIGKRVGLTAPAVAERIRKMEDAGIISGYHAHVNPDKLGYPIMAYIQLTMLNSQLEEQVAELVLTMPEVIECHNVTGKDSFFIRVTVTSMAHLERIVKSFHPYATTTTSIVMYTPVSHRVLKNEH